MGRYGNKDLPQRNLASALIALENSRSAADLKRAVESLVDWLREPEDQGLKRSFGEWIIECDTGADLLQCARDVMPGS